MTLPSDTSNAVAALEVLVQAVEHHRDRMWGGGPVLDAPDAELYEAAVWVRDNEQELGLQ
jgi:hypothetical protein